MEKSLKEKRGLIAACVIFGIAVGYSINYLILSKEAGIPVNIFTKLGPFIFIAIAMLFYAIGLIIKIKKSEKS